MMNIHWVWYRLHNHSKFLHTQGDSLYRSTLEYNKRMQVHIGLRILLQCLHLWKLIMENPITFLQRPTVTLSLYTKLLLTGMFWQEVIPGNQHRSRQKAKSVFFFAWLWQRNWLSLELKRNLNICENSHSVNSLR